MTRQTDKAELTARQKTEQDKTEKAASGQTEKIRLPD
jgi:hypothetical protein